LHGAQADADDDDDGFDEEPSEEELFYSPLPPLRGESARG
jgi:hypothetical protein